MKAATLGLATCLFGLAICVLVLAYLQIGGLNKPLGHNEQMPGMFETTGGGAVTIGCSLWDVPAKGESYDGDGHDFVLQSDRDNLMMIVVHDGTTYVISGQQCGYSLDWRRFPPTERKPDGILRAASEQ